MFDTIAYHCWLALLDNFRERRLPQGWSATTFTTPGEARTFDTILKHDLLDIRMFVKDTVVRKIEAELPKLLFGHNGRLIENESQRVAALIALKAVLRTVCEPYTNKAGYYPGDAPLDTQTYFTRVDLVWQFDIDPAFAALALRNAKHPSIHKRNGEYKGETLIFPGTNLRILVYDKVRKMRANCPHHATRIEIQLSGEVLNQRLGQEGHALTDVQFDAAWKVYRNTLLQFRFLPLPEPNAEGTIADFLALLVPRLPDDDVVGLYCFSKKMCPRRARELRKNVGSRVPSLVNFSFKDLLPEEGPPCPVTVPSPQKEARLALFMKQCPSL